MDEKVFLESGSIKVTNARFVVGNQTYAMASVNSVKVSSVDVTPSNTLPGIFIIVGAIWGLGAFMESGSPGSYFWPTALLVTGIFWIRSIKKTIEYGIVLTTSSGETPALKSTNESDIYPVEKALHDAIIFRG